MNPLPKSLMFDRCMKAAVACFRSSRFLCSGSTRAGVGKPIPDGADRPVLASRDESLTLGVGEARVLGT